jgi:small subunit ribosomal protein S21
LRYALAAAKCEFAGLLLRDLGITNDLFDDYLPQGVFWTLPILGLFGGVFFLAEVRVQEGEPLENALRRFKRKVQTEDIIKEVKRHSFYLKPGEKKRVKEALARKRNRKKVRKEQD